MSAPTAETSQTQDEAPTAVPTLPALALLFLRLGTTAFGGPAAHLGLMEEEVVRRRRWLTRAQFLDLLGAVNLIPGPNSTELAIHIGLRAGWAGLLVAGVSFILPAAILVTLLAWAYCTFGELPPVKGLLYGVKPVIIAVVVQAFCRLARTSVRTVLLAAVGLLVIALAALDVDGLLLMLTAGMICATCRAVLRRQSPILGIAAFPLANAAGAPVAVGLWPLFLFFLKVGSVLFGSGYVLLAFLRADLVERWHWITEDELLDAVAVGQLTPGPLFTTATFIGYLLGDVPGAIVATVGIFLPAFFFVAISGPLLPRLRRSPTAGAFLDGVVVASLGLMAVVTWQLAWAALVDAPTIVLTLASALLLLHYRVSSLWLVLGGGLAGWLLTWVGWGG
jgi:chromate transporter